MPVPNSTALVAQIKADLLARGVIQPRQEDNGDAAEITWRVAWALRDKGAKLIRKSPAQNGWTAEAGPYAGQRFSHDSIAFSDGYVDLLASAGPPANENRPVWQWKAGVSPSVADPFDLDAREAPPVSGNGEDTEPGDEIPTPEEDFIGIVLAALKLELAPLARDIAEIKAVQARGLAIPYLGVAKPPAAKGNGAP
jgi:hypothetical protein